MEWFPRTFAMVLAMLAVAFFVDFVWRDLDLQKTGRPREVCPDCIRESRDPERGHRSRCFIGPYNRTCPDCGAGWRNTAFSFLWFPEPLTLAGLVLLIGILSGRVFSCPPCGGRSYARPFRATGDPEPRCPQCGGKGRLSLLKWWLVLDRTARPSRR